MSLINSIALAIHLSAPFLADYKVANYSKVIIAESQKINVSPYIFIAIIYNESKWNYHLISLDGEDYGLMQVRAKYSAYTKQELLVGEYNIMAGARVIKYSQKFCDNRLHRSSNTQEWLSCYQGSCTGPRKHCKPNSFTNRIEQYAQCLQYAVEEKSCLFDCSMILR